MSYIRCIPLQRCETVMDTETTLSKWGNGRGVRIPAEVCAELGISVGDIADIEVDELRSSVTFAFRKNKQRSYSRHRKMTMEEFASGWSGGKTATKEWGGEDIGAEVVE